MIRKLIGKSSLRLEKGNEEVLEWLDNKESKNAYILDLIENDIKLAKK